MDLGSVTRVIEVDLSASFLSWRGRLYTELPFFIIIYLFGRLEAPLSITEPKSINLQKFENHLLFFRADFFGRSSTELPIDATIEFTKSFLLRLVGVALCVKCRYAMMF